MNSIRPLVTITILIVVGAFLYVKINQGPARPAPNANDAWPSQLTDGVPPLAASTGAPTADAAAPPAWPASTSPAVLNAESSDPATPTTANATAPQAPVVPAIPEMPQLAAAPDAAAAMVPDAAMAQLPAELPANIPTARYPDQPGTAPLAAPGLAANQHVPTTNGGAATEALAPPITPIEPPPATPEQANALSQQTTDFQSPPLAAQQNPLRSAPTPTPEVDRYGIITSASSPTDNTARPPAAQSSFATSWPEIEATLKRGELANAHQLLSRWYDDPSLTPTDKELVDTLLSQLAGTVVYSTEHQLEPPYIVKTGETLETIAKEYNVPWQLLAKINGIPAADQVQPGQQLKVVRGPFSAVVDLSRKQLTLLLDGRYAGRFAVSTEPGSELPTGEWLVHEKPITPAPQGPVYASPGSSIAAQSPAQPAASRSLVLRGAAPETATTTMHIGVGPAVDTRETVYQGIPATTQAVSPNLVKVSPADAEELADILSIGSRVIVRR